jgi:hypothetical protein
VCRVVGKGVSGGRGAGTAEQCSRAARRREVQRAATHLLATGQAPCRQPFSAWFGLGRMLAADGPLSLAQCPRDTEMERWRQTQPRQGV